MMRRSFTGGLLIGGSLLAVGPQVAFGAIGGCVVKMNVDLDFQGYVDAFNRGDFERLGRYYAQDVDFQGRAGNFHGREQVLKFYRNARPRLQEKLTVLDLIKGPQTLFVDMRTQLQALENWPNFPTGALRKGDQRVSENFIWYDIVEGKFTVIRSARYAVSEVVARIPATAIPDCTEPEMTPTRFAEYIDAFNRDDYAHFGDYYDENVVLVIVGKKELRGRQAIFDFYRTAKSQAHRVIQVNRLITAPGRIAAELQSEFVATIDTPEFMAGPMKKGDRIFINTFVLYELHNGKFARIRSAELRKIAHPA
jgi:ketosteroid isomerase-like protein